MVILLLLVAYFASNRNPNQDKLTGNAVSEAQPSTPEKRCASQATYDLIKRELFRRAAQLRGSDQATFDNLATYAAIRMENPVMENQDSTTGAIHCSGSLSLDLPPGVAVVGGRTSLMSDIDYTIQPAADASGDVVLLQNVDAIVAPLATLSRVGQPAQQSGIAAESNLVAPSPDTNAPATVALPAPAPAPSTQPTARPSFDCAGARTRGEIAVCADPGLAALDRNMAAQYGRATAGASPDQRQLLQQTRNRFLAYRDRCANRQCMSDAYVGRMREIGDIMEGRWQPR
jgi:uncharacterized protein YecT (DUF1311 family)